MMENESKKPEDKIQYIKRDDGLFIKVDSILKLIDDSIESAIKVSESEQIPSEIILGMTALKELFLRDIDRINISGLID